MTRALIYGGRDWDDQATMDRVLDAIHAERRIRWVINGGQASRAGDRLFGADWQADTWTTRRRLPILRFYADWRRLGAKAGPIRNTRMLVEGEPDIGIEFPGGRGTRDMRGKLLAAGVPVILAVDHPAFTAQDAAA